MTCTTCGGDQGRAEVTTEDGVYRETWIPCQPCGGTGVQR